MPLAEPSHYAIRTLDLEAPRQFYCEVLGLTVGPRPPFGFPGLWLYNGDHDDYRNAVVHLIGRDTSQAQSQADTGSLDHIAFMASGLAEMQSRLESLGIAYRWREVPVLGLQQLFVIDPGGIKIELNYAANERTTASSAPKT